MKGKLILVALALGSLAIFSFADIVSAATPRGTVCVYAGTTTQGQTKSGIDIYEQSSLSLYSTSLRQSIGTKTDTCVDDSVREFYCVPRGRTNNRYDLIRSTLKSCQYGCTDGACNSAPAEPPITPPETNSTQPGTNPPPDTGSRMVKGNGIVTNIWVPSFDEFKAHNIKYLYVDIGDVDKNTGLITTPWDQIQSFIAREKAYESANNYDFIILPWNVVIPMEGYNFDSPTFRANYINEYVKLVSMGFDGVHLDVEAIPSSYQKQSYLEMINQFKARLPSNALITAYAGNIGDNAYSEWVWSFNFFKAVCDNVDSISTQGYDIGYTDTTSYTNYLADQMRILGTNTWNCDFMWTFPTHKSSPETLSIAVPLFEREIAKYPNSRIVGTEIFASWTTDSGEWQYYQDFLNRQG